LKSNYLIPPGFKDNVGFDAYVEHEFKNNIINFFRSNGFDLVKTSLIDYSGNNNQNNLLIDIKKNEDSLKIRDDITPQIIRVASSRLLKKNRPLKLCYYGEVVRKSGTMLRPERQFLQVGAETIGSNNILADIEIIDLAYKSLCKIGIKNITIELSSKIFLDKIFNKLKKTILINKLKQFIKQKDLKNCLNILSDTDDKKLLSDIFQCSGKFSKINKLLIKLVKDNKTKKEVNDIQTICSKIYLKKKDNIILDFSDFDEKKYHDGIKFTFFAKNVRGEIASGGRYKIKHNLHYETATGFTCFMDSVLRASSFENLDKKILIPNNLNNKIKLNLINKGFSLFVIFDEINDLKNEARNFACSHYFENKKIIKV